MPNAKLLVLCGNAERRESFVSELSKAGWQGILCASSMSEAVKILRDAANACVIVDAELEDIPGLKAIPILRNLCEQIKIVFTAPKNTRSNLAWMSGPTFAISSKNIVPPLASSNRPCFMLVAPVKEPLM